MFRKGMYVQKGKVVFRKGWYVQKGEVCSERGGGVQCCIENKIFNMYFAIPPQMPMR